MDEAIKKEIWRVFSVAAFLFISIFFVLPYLVQISTYFHEKAHIKILNSYNIESEYKIDLLGTIPQFFDPNVKKLGVTTFNLQNYLKLNKEQRTEINVAGIISDLKFLFLIGIYLSLVNIYIFYRIRLKQSYNLTVLLAINWILFMWLLALIQITVANITYPLGDISQLIKFLKI